MPKSLLAMVAIVVVVAVVASAITYHVATRGGDEARDGSGIDVASSPENAKPVAENAPAAPETRGRTIRRPKNAAGREVRRSTDSRHRRMSDVVRNGSSTTNGDGTAAGTLVERRGTASHPINATDPEKRREMQERTLYRPSAMTRVQALEASSDESLHLTAAQRKEIDAVEVWLREESKEQLADILSEQAELQARISDLYREKAAIQKELNKKFVEAIRSTLSPEQMAIVDVKGRFVLPHPKDVGAP